MQLINVFNKSTTTVGSSYKASGLKYSPHVQTTQITSLGGFTFHCMPLSTFLCCLGTRIIYLRIKKCNKYKITSKVFVSRGQGTHYLWLLGLNIVRRYICVEHYAMSILCLLSPLPPLILFPFRELVYTTRHCKVLLVYFCL